MYKTIQIVQHNTNTYKTHIQKQYNKHNTLATTYTNHTHTFTNSLKNRTQPYTQRTQTKHKRTQTIQQPCTTNAKHTKPYKQRTQTI